ncbi:MAG: sulfatase-like hydrolase/transferase [Verrucomicrobiota bacterium]
MSHPLSALFIDADGFFASCEEHFDPTLRGRPVGVVPMVAETTCCIASNYAAKAFGVKTGTSVRDARRQCPGIVLVEAKPAEYVKIHHRIIEAVGMRPHDVGFDEYYGCYPAQKEITQSVDKRRFPKLSVDQEQAEAYKELGMGHSLVHGWKGGKTEEVSAIKSTEDMARADKGLADFTVAKLKELAKGGQPFFLEHAFMKVHCDNFANPDFEGLSAAKYPYKDALAEVDLHVGTIVKTLEEAGLLENTLVFLTSDNGPQMDAWPDAGYTPFRGAKGTTWEGGVRVPGIAYWKGMIQPGRQSDDVFDLMDLFGTSLKLAGVPTEKLPTDRYYDFVDQTSFLLADDGKSNRETVYFWWGKELMACRMHEYKAHIKVILPQAPHMHIDMATIQDVGLAPWFFNLYLDPKEEMTVGHRLDPWMASVAGKLKAHGATFKKYPPKQIGL